MLASLCFGLLIFLLGCQDRSETSAVTRLSGPTMGTSYNITVVAEVSDRETLQAKIDQLLVDINQSMSTYIPGSEINRLTGSPVERSINISQPLMEVLTTARQVSEISGGAFDITLRPLIDLWGFGPEFHQDQIPSKERIETVLQSVGFQHLSLDPKALTVTKGAPISLDLSAVAKGYAADQVADLLASEGYQNALVEIGGEMVLRGLSARGENWRIAVEEPVEGQAGVVHEALALTGVGVATSGDYRNFFEKEGVRYSHTIDPLTGYPVTHELASVTVVMPSCALADAFATAFTVLGAEKGLALANENGIAALFIERSENGFETRYSDAMKSYR